MILQIGSEILSFLKVY